MSLYWVLTRTDGVRCVPSVVIESATADAVVNAAGREVFEALCDEVNLRAEDVYAGRFAKARAERRRSASECLWQGSVGEVSFDGQRVRFVVDGPVHGLKRLMLRTYLKACDATLGDSRCGVDLSTGGRTQALSVDAVRGRGSFVCNALIGSTQPWLAGGVRFTSGRNGGFAAVVRDFNAAEGSLVLDVPPPFAISVGDGVVLRVGCDKTFASCSGIFNNALNFRGCPSMPSAGTLFATPTLGDNNDGGVV